METTDIIRIILAALFGVAGLAKLAGVGRLRQSFTTFGYPIWFMYLIGVSEIGGAVFLLIPPIAAIGAIGLGFIMVGAFFSHLRAKETPQTIPVVVLFVLSVITVVGMWPNFIDFIA